MVTVALYVKLDAKPGKEAEVESFLKGGLAIVQEEPATTAWFALRIGPSTFGIFDAFPDEAGRAAHLAGRVAAALMAKAADLLATRRRSRRSTSSRQNCPEAVVARAAQGPPLRPRSVFGSVGAGLAPPAFA